MNELKEIYTEKIFEEIKHINEFGEEYWSARELMPILQYSNWQNFEKIIDKAKVACQNSNAQVVDHFTDSEKWKKQYSASLKIWEDNWDAICPFFQFSDGIRKIMYTTNSIESLNRQYRYKKQIGLSNRYGSDEMFIFSH